MRLIAVSKPVAMAAAPIVAGYTGTQHGSLLFDCVIL